MWCWNRCRLSVLFSFLLASGQFSAVLASEDDIQRVKRGLQKVVQYDNFSARRLAMGWFALLDNISNKPLSEQLEWINNYINKIPYTDDVQQWQVADYWATPIELFHAGRGDCEDLAIAKYFTLRALQVEDNDLRLIYVKQRDTAQPHMILAVLQNNTWWVLDSANADILPLEQRSDLVPVYEFNGESLWITRSTTHQDLVGPAQRIGQWAALHERLH